MLRSLRGIVLMVSYEAVFSFFFLLLIIEFFSYSFLNFFNSQISLFIFLIILIVFLCELNRIPFDLSEAESELVSRYNTEYSRRPFTFLFLSEYISILFFCCLISVFFLKDLFFRIFIFVFFCLIRSALPRIKFFSVIELIWLFLLPVSVVFLLMYFMYY